MKSATFKIDSKLDREDTEKLMERLGYPIIMIALTADYMSGKEFLGVYTVAVPKHHHIDAIATLLYLIINETDNLKALTTIYKTLNEGIYPNYDFQFNND